MIKLPLGKTIETEAIKAGWCFRTWKYEINGIILGTIFKRIALAGTPPEWGNTIYTFTPSIHWDPTAYHKIRTVESHNTTMDIYQTKKDAQKALRHFISLQLEALLYDGD